MLEYKRIDISEEIEIKKQIIKRMHVLSLLVFFR